MKNISYIQKRKIKNVISFINKDHHSLRISVALFGCLIKDLFHEKN